MKRLIGLIAVAFMMFGLPVVHAADTNDATMAVMDATDSHASDVTSETEVPEAANEHANAADENRTEDSASSEQEQETDQSEAVSEHSDEAHESAETENDNEIESQSQDSQSQDSQPQDSQSQDSGN